MELSKRLTMIADMVSAQSRVADIGTDHGFIPIKLVSEGKCPCAIAMDVGKGPLARAVEHIAGCGLSDRIECRLSDGYEKLEAGEADSTVIAGMGGGLMVRILEAGDTRGVLTKELILSPHSEWHKVRHFLHNHGYAIEEERMLFEEGKYYVAIRAEFAGDQAESEAMDAVEEAFGPDLLTKKDSVLYDYLIFMKNRYEKIFHSLAGNESASARERSAEIIKDLDLIKGALARYETM